MKLRVQDSYGQTRFYEVLGVERGASEAELKRLTAASP